MKTLPRAQAPIFFSLAFHGPSSSSTAIKQLSCAPPLEIGLQNSGTLTHSPNDDIFHFSWLVNAILDTPCYLPASSSCRPLPSCCPLVCTLIPVRCLQSFHCHFMSLDRYRLTPPPTSCWLPLSLYCRFHSVFSQRATILSFLSITQGLFQVSPLSGFLAWLQRSLGCLDLSLTNYTPFNTRCIDHIDFDQSMMCQATYYPFLLPSNQCWRRYTLP